MVVNGTNGTNGTKQFTFTVHGFDGCGFFNNAVRLLEQVQKKKSNLVDIDIKSVPRTFWPMVIHKYATSEGIAHTTSPMIFCNGIYIGGFDALSKIIT